MNQPRRIFLNEMTQGLSTTLQPGDPDSLLGGKESLRITGEQQAGYSAVLLKEPEDQDGSWVPSSNTTLNEFAPYLPHIMAITDTGILNRDELVSQQNMAIVETPTYTVNYGNVEAMQIAFNRLLAHMENRLAVALYRQIRKYLEAGSDVVAIRPPWLNYYDPLGDHLEFDAKLLVYGLSKEDGERGDIKRYDPVTEQHELNKHLYKDFSLYCSELNEVRDILYNWRESQSSK